MKKKVSIGYEILRIPVWIGTRLFYRKIKVHGLENIPEKNQGTILISNHQNGMMDPVMLCVSIMRQLHFLTRADIFKDKLTNKLLRHLNMLPVYRALDKVADIAAMNDDTFAKSYKRILNGDVVSMFPEGNHNNKKWIRPFRKGISRVTFGAMEMADFQRDIKIIPIGIDYTSYTKFRSEILLNFGKPISTIKYADLYKKDPARALTILAKESNAALKALVVDVTDKDNYDWLIETEMLALETHPSGDKNYSKHLDRVNTFKDFLSKWDLYRAENTNSSKDISDKAKKYLTLRKKLSLTERSIWQSNQNYETFMPMIGMALILPIILIGVSLNVLPGMITRKFVNTQVKDPHFTSSISMVIGVIFFGIFWPLQGLLVSWLTSWSWALPITFLAAPLTGLITVECWRLYSQIKDVIKWRKLLKKKNIDAQTLKKLRSELASYFREISKPASLV